MQDAPGHPGIEPRWTSSDKAGVGTALSALSRVWFTISHGILNEIYFPRVDQACMRDFGLLISDGAGYFSEEKRDCHHLVASLEDGVPAFRLTNTAIDGRYRIVKSIVSDTKRDVVLQSIRLQKLSHGKLRLFALLAPHLVNGGAHNTGWVGEYKGQEMLFAEGDGTTIALAASVPWRARSAGFVGASDGWSEINRTGGLNTCYDRATDGNVALTGELDIEAAGDGEIVWRSASGAIRPRLRCVRGSAWRKGYNVARSYVEAWRSWQQGLLPFDRIGANRRNTYRISTAVLRSHELPELSRSLHRRSLNSLGL